jgi:membrane protein DedA with SNARE-associated domain
VPGFGEAALIAAGVLAARGRLDLAEVVAVAFAGATAGGVAGWLIGLKLGRSVFTRTGPLHATRVRVLAAGERFYDRYGMLAVLFTPSWLAGIHRMRSRTYLPVNAVSAILWAVVVGVGAYLVGPSIGDVVDDVGLVGAGLVACVAAVGWTVGRRSRGRRVGRPPDG